MAIITRTSKGSALTYAELDNNFTELANATNNLNQIVTNSATNGVASAGIGIQLNIADTNTQTDASIVLDKFVGGTATPSPVLTNVDLSVNAVAASGSGDLSYSSANKQFTFTPPDLTSFLTSSSSIGSAQLPAIAVTSVQTAADQAAQLALTTQEGDVVVRTDESKSYVRNNGTADPHDMTNFTLLQTPDADTTYGMTISQTGSGTDAVLNDNPILKLDPSNGTDIDITLTGGANTTVTRVSDTEVSIASTDTWQANAVGVDGYVEGPVNDATGQNKVWKTDASGVPAWRDDLDTTLSTGTSTALQKGDGSGGLTDATAGTDYSTLSTGTSTAILKGDGSGGFSDASAGTDYSTLAIGTSNTTALAGDTVVDNLLLEIPKSGGSVNIGDKTFLKVATVTMDARYQYYSAQLAVVGTGAAEGVANEKILAIRVKQQADMGNPPLVDIDIYNNGNEDYDFGHVVAVNSGTETRVDIYFRPDGPNSGAEVYKMADTATATVAWSSTGNSYATSAPANFVQGGAHQQWHSGNQAGIFGSLNGLLKANGSGVLSAAVAGTDYSTLAIGTSATTAMAGNTTFAFADITSKPTTISGYGITDSLAIGTSATTAMAGNTTFAFSDITSKPTTISGYGITDALAIGTSATTAMAGNTTFAFADITSKPTTISGYGITDALAIGTSATTAMAGNTALSAIGGSLDLSSQVTGTLPVGNMSATALTTVQTAANQAAQLALTTQEGDVVVRTDENKTYMRNSGTADPHDMTNFTLLATPTDAVTSVDGNTGVVTTLQIGTSATTAMAGNTTFAFSDITSKPTTISGYGITDALAIGTSGTTAMAGNTTFAFSDITSKPTTISGYGITDALAIGTSATTAMAGNTTFAFSDITSKPTTISGYGITDALAIGTSGTTAMAGNTTFAFSDITSKPTTISGYGITDALTIGTSGTTAMAGNTTFDRITEGDTSIIITDTGTPPSADNNIVVTVAGSQKAKFDYTGTEIAGGATNTQTIGSTTQTGTITLGRSTKDNTINIGNAATESDQEQIINIGSGTGSGTSTVNIAAKTSQGNDTAVTIGGNDPSTGTCTVAINGTTTVGLGNTTFQGNNFLVNPSLSTNTITLGSTSGTGTITIGRSTAQQDILIGAGATVPNSGVRHIQLGELSTGVRKITLEPSNNTVDVMCNANSLNQQLTGINLYNTPTTGNTATTGFQFGGYLGQNKITSYYGSGSSADILMNFAMGGDKFIFTGGGRLGVGTTNPAQELHVVGDIIATGNVTAYYSDERLKDLKGAIPNALEKVNKLTGYYYTPNDLAHSLGVDNTGIEVGVSAQEVESVLPEVVTDSAVGMSEFRENYKTVQYDRLTPLLIESIKELTQKVAELEAKLEERGE